MSAEHVRTEANDPFCLKDIELQRRLAGAPYRRFGVIGDSLSLGVGAPTPGYRNGGWSDRVAELMGRTHRDAAYLNLAQIGATTIRVIDEQLPAMRGFAPDLLHLPCGANDIMRRRVDFAAIESDLHRMWSLAHDTGADLQTFTLGRAFVVPALDDWGERIRRLNDLTRTFAARYAAVLVDMWDHPVNDRTDLVSPDGVHFSTSGQAVLATQVIRAITADCVRLAAGGSDRS